MTLFLTDVSHETHVSSSPRQSPRPPSTPLQFVPGTPFAGCLVAQKTFRGLWCFLHFRVSGHLREHNDLKMAYDGPTIQQQRPRWLPDGQKRLRGSPKMAHKDPQDGPRRSQYSDAMLLKMAIS